MDKKTVLHFLRGFLTLLLALLMLLVPLYMGCIRLFEKRQMEQTGETLQNGMTRLDQQITALSAIAASLGQNSKYRIYAMRDPSAMTPGEYYNLGLLHTEFRRICLSQPYVSDYALLFRNHILFARERVHMANEAYYGSFVSFEGYDEAAFFSAFLSPQATSMFLPETAVCMTRDGEKDTYRAISWLCSMSQVYSRHPAGVFFATLSRETLAALLMPGLNQEQAGLVLETRAGTELTRFGVEDGSQAHSLTCVGAQTGLKATLTLSEHLFVNMMAPIRRFLICCILALAAVGLAVSGLLARRASKPINRLVSLVHQAGNAASYQGGAKDSFELIGNAVTGLNSSVDAYRETLLKQQESVRDHIFETMLRETPVRDGAADRRHIQEFASCFPAFPEKYRLALLVMTEGEAEATLDELPRRQVLLSALIKACVLPEPYLYFSGRRTFVVLSAAQASCEEQLIQLKRAAREKLSMPLIAALSDEGTGCEQLHALSQQARSIIRLVGTAEDGAPVEVWQKQNFPNQLEEIPLDYTEMEQLHAALVRGEKEAALSLLASVRQKLRPVSFLDVVMAQQTFYNIRGVLLRVKMERFSALYSVDIPEYHGDLSEDKQYNALMRCCENICDVLKPLRATPQTAFSGAVCRFIDENLSDSALCARMVADRFGISEPTLQKVVRQEKSCSFFDYVENGRHALAVSLLTSTDLSIADISAQCGYNSPNSFYKAFKRLSKLTPVAVRQSARGAG